MALTTLAVFDTKENKRSDLTYRTLYDLIKKNDFTKHRIFISDNGSCDETQDIFIEFQEKFDSLFPKENLTIRHNGKNLGTANAINLGWRTRKKEEYAIKMDNDVEVDYYNWIDLMEEACIRQPKMGLLGAKRNDLDEFPENPNPEWKTTLVMLPHKRGQRWISVEQCRGVFGTIQMYTPQLLEKIGYLLQPHIYGFDDMISALRCTVGGFGQAYISNVTIHHIDVTPTDYWEEKRKLAGESMEAFNQMRQEIIDGIRPIYYEPKWEELV